MNLWQGGKFSKTVNLKREIEGCRVQYLKYF